MRRWADVKTLTRPRRVFFLQPLIPHYRVPFFARLSRVDGLDLHLHASLEQPGLTLKSDGRAVTELGCVMHPCRALANGQLFWQSGLSIPKTFGRGDVAVIPGAPRFLSNYTAAIEARRRGVSLLYFGMGFGTGEDAKAVSLKLRLRRLLAQRFDGVILYTEREAEAYVAAGLPATKVCGMNNALDIEPMLNAQAAVDALALEAFKARLDLVGRRVLLLVGRLTQKARGALLVEALVHLPKDYVAVFIGGGELENELRALAIRKGVEVRTRFVGPLYDEGQLAPYFLTADLLVYPGSIGLSILHAFAYGLPVVTHGDEPAQFPEFAALSKGQNGDTFEAGDSGALASTVLRLTLDVPGLERMREGARETVRNAWHIDSMVDRFAGAIERAGGLN